MTQNHLVVINHLALYDPPLALAFWPLPLEVAGAVEVLARVDGWPVCVRQGRVLATTFHPELTDDLRIHRLLLDL